MVNCLGLYIEENLIKYAKVSKDRDNVKVEAFGVKFYEKIGDAINQIVEETYSQKVPISINLSEEMYNYFEMFALLTKSDLQRAITTEFESYCSKKGYNPNVFETRTAIIDTKSATDSLQVIHVAENKIELNKLIQQVEGYKLTNISPISMSIPNLAMIGDKENLIIVNMEGKTTITTILDSKISHIDIIEDGSETILEKINLKENSYSKAYEICKNTTIYTTAGADLQQDEMGYLDEMMPTLYKILGEVRKKINESPEKIDKVYITGTAALINNVDLYFQEYLGGMECEVLKPYFVQSVRDINIKDYIEVNSAISLALMGLGDGIQGMNFKKNSFIEKMPDWMKIEVGGSKPKTPGQKKNSGGMLTWDLDRQLDKTEQGLVRIATGLSLLTIIYSGLSGVLSYQMDRKIEEAKNSISDTKNQIMLANADSEKIKTKTSEYSTMIKNLEDMNARVADAYRTKNAIPNLLNQIMFVIPENVQITSIENTTGRHIVINAQSDKYEQLGYLKAKIKSDVILNNVISTAGQKDNNIVTVKIEGDLP